MGGDGEVARGGEVEGGGRRAAGGGGRRDWPTLEGTYGRAVEAQPTMGGRSRREQAEPMGWFGLGGWRKKKIRDRRYTTDVGCQSNGW